MEDVRNNNPLSAKYFSFLPSLIKEIDDNK